jgi:hypothetical protein
MGKFFAFLWSAPMNRDIGRAAYNRRAALAALLQITAMAAPMVIGRPVTVLAQNNPPPGASQQMGEPRPSMSQDRMEAPIGHRQPRPQDLPESVRREEGERSPAERSLDEKLQICRGC